MIVVGKTHQEIVGKRLRSRLDIAVFPLRDPNGAGNLLLSQVVILAQIFDSIVQATPPPGRKIINYSIDEKYLLTFR